MTVFLIFVDFCCILTSSNFVLEKIDMLHTFNELELIDLQSETNYAFHSSIAEHEFPQVHDFYELSLITAGRMDLTVGEERFLADSGSLVLIQPGFVHAKRDLGGCHYMNIAFPARTMEDCLRFLGLESLFIAEKQLSLSTPFVQISQADSLDLQNHLHRLSVLPESEIRRVRAGVRFLVINCLWRWFIPAITGSVRLSGPVWLQELILQLENRENLAAGLPFMMEYSGKSQEYLCRTFQKYLSETPAGYLTRKRLDLAANLLVHSDMSPLDVAFETGYQNGSTFYHNFTRRFGLSPGKYRALYRERKMLAMSKENEYD